MNVKSGQTKARGACMLSLPRVKLTLRAPCIYRTAPFENRTMGKTLSRIREGRPPCNPYGSNLLAAPKLVTVTSRFARVAATCSSRRSCCSISRRETSLVAFESR